MKLTKEERKMVIKAAEKAKDGDAKPVMFFGTACSNLVGGLDKKLHMIDFLPYQDALEKNLGAAKDNFFENTERVLTILNDIR